MESWEPAWHRQVKNYITRRAGLWPVSAPRTRGAPMNEHQQRALWLDLEGLAKTWSTFRDRHGDTASPTFCNGLEECARQLTEALDRAKQLARADA